MLAEASVGGAESANTARINPRWTGEPRGNDGGARGLAGEEFESQTRCAQACISHVEPDVLRVAHNQLGRITIHKHTMWIPERP